MWLLQVGVPLKVLWGYSAATGCTVASVTVPYTHINMFSGRVLFHFFFFLGILVNWWYCITDLKPLTACHVTVSNFYHPPSFHLSVCRYKQSQNSKLFTLLYFISCVNNIDNHFTPTGCVKFQRSSCICHSKLRSVDYMGFNLWP